MKKLYLVVILIILICIQKGFSQVPVYTLEAKNFAQLNANQLIFDLIFTHTDATPMELAGWQFFFKVPQTIGTIGTGTGLNSSFYYDSTGGDAISDLPVGFRPRNPQAVVAGNAPGNYELRLAANSLPGCGNGLLIQQGIPILIGRYKIISSTPLDVSAVNSLIIRDSCESPLSVTRTKINWYDANDCLNKEMTRCASHSVYPVFINSPIVNFNSDRQIIFAGETVNFFDGSSNNPNSWNWTFTGGTPSNSTVKNPAGIRYNTPGVYSVTLSASNPFGSNMLTKTNYITVNPPQNSCPITWQSMIIASDAANKKDTVKIGMSTNGSYGIDTCLGEYLLPPPPPVGAFDFRLILPPTYTLDATKFDFRKDTLSSVIYWLNFQTSVSGPITFTWDPSSFPTTGQFFLREDIMGTNINMKSQNSFSLNNQGIRYLRIDYEFRATYPISVRNGWNIISIPLQAFDMSVSSLFEFDVTTAFNYINGYTNVTTLNNGTGYWINFPTTRNYDISGIVRYNKNINVQNGWNIIGPFEENIPVSEIVTFPNGILTSDFFGYNNGYFSEDTLVPGKGYWIKTNAPGIIMKDTNDSFIPLISNETDNNLNDNFKIEFTDFNQNVSNLYLLNENEPTSQYELPPVPPAGIFDVRFGSDKFAESFGKSNMIKINSAERPLKIKIYNLQNKKIRIKDNIDGSILNKLLSENEEILISSPLDNLVLIDESSIPDSYAVGQNYPNPFNPSTVIKYQIPKDGHVRIIIYDILGKEVLKLVDKYQQTGRYEVNFNAADLSSGVYFYKFESGNFNDLRKMMLLK